MNKKEEWIRLILVLSMLIGVIAVTLVSSGNLKKMGAYKESTALSDYGEKFIDYYHNSFDDKVVPVGKKKIQLEVKKIQVSGLAKKEMTKKKEVVPRQLVDARGNVYHLEHIVTIKKKDNLAKPKKIVKLSKKEENKGKLND